MEKNYFQNKKKKQLSQPLISKLDEFLYLKHLSFTLHTNYFLTEFVLYWKKKNSTI